MREHNPTGQSARAARRAHESHTCVAETSAVCSLRSPERIHEGMSILLAVLGISILVIVHEAGHYLAARAFGMRVLRFSIGFGPTIAKFQPAGSSTVFQIGLVPFLAYVQVAGMNPAEENDPNDPELYPNKGVLARFVTIFAGPFANYLIASALVFTLALLGHHGENKPHEPMLVETVQPGSPAEKAGVRAGDVIVEADQRPVKNVDDLKQVTAPRAKKPTIYVIERDKQRLPLTIVPIEDHGAGIIGIIAAARHDPMPVGRALTYSVLYPFELTLHQLEGFVHMFRQGSTEGVVGPVGMVKIVATRTGSFVQLANILILISVALGMFNLMPLPALDGGRLVFLGYEIITRRRANERVENLVHTVGLVLLLCLIALVTLRDVAG
jgi:regulator of sigma E protease